MASGIAVKPGWWKASDGCWYAPEQHPDFVHDAVYVAAPELSVLEEPALLDNPGRSSSSQIDVAAERPEVDSDPEVGAGGSDELQLPTDVRPEPVSVAAFTTTNLCAVISLFCVLGLPFPLAGIIFGSIANKQINEARRNGVHERGIGMASWGILLGLIELVVVVIVVVNLSSQTPACDPTFGSC